MSLALPATLSPSKVSSFTDCALAFRFATIDRLPDRPTVAATRGTLVHRALELLLTRPAPGRTVAAAISDVHLAFATLQTDPDYTALGLEPDREARFLDDAEALVRRYFELEDPTAVRPIGLELMLESTIGDLRVRGIIDRLELDDAGHLVVTDYKTGRVPSARQEHARLGGVHFYSFLCEQLFGVRPARVQLLYLSEPVAIITRPTEQSTRGLQRKVRAIWSAVETACERDDFRPNPSATCHWCSYRDYCPVFGGDPARGRAEAERLRAQARSDRRIAAAEASGQSPLPLALDAPDHLVAVP